MESGVSIEQVQRFMEMAGAGKIKPSGDNLIGTCPFHNDTHRSFSMNVYTGQFCCFSESCGMQGGLLAFLIKGCGFSFEKAKDYADEWSTWEGKGTEAGWETEFPSWEQRRRGGESQEPIPERLLGLYDFCPKYMTKKRGFFREVLQRWEIGYDFELDRVTFAVRDEHGNLIGFSKRATRSGVDPKYLHLGFKRSQVLYGEFFVPQTSREVWVTEGQIDALALWQMGIPYPVSTMSAKVGQRQINRLARYSRVVLAFDDDEDGRSAARKVGDHLLENGHRHVYVARQFGRFKDPGEILEKGTVRRIYRFTAAREPYDLVRLDW